jgi:hypothetical protein
LRFFKGGGMVIPNTHDFPNLAHAPEALVKLGRQPRLPVRGMAIVVDAAIGSGDSAFA